MSFVLIGGLAATAHGSPQITNDVDITPERARENVAQLALPLKELHARIRTASEPDGIPFDHDAESLARTEMLYLVTDFGDLDVSFTPTGTRGFGDLTRQAVRMMPFCVPTQAASLADVVRSKEAAGRLKDLAALPTLRRLLEAEENERRGR